MEGNDKYNMFDFIKLPNRLFYPIEEDESLLQKIKDDKVVLILDYLYYNTNRLEIIKFTLEDMIIECGYKPNTGAKKSNSQFKNILSKLKELEVIRINDEDFNAIKPTSLVKCSLDLIKMKKNKKGEESEEGFVTLTLLEKNKILSQDIEKVDNLKLLIYYCYLKCRMWKLSKDENLQRDGGKAPVCYPSYDLINKELGLTDESIKKYNDLLIKLDLIRISNPGLWYYTTDPNKIVRESSNIYTLFTTDEEEWKLNLKEGIKQWKNIESNANKFFTGKQVYKNNNRQLNGELASIKKKEKNNKASEKDLERKAELLEFMGENIEQKFKIQSLLDTHKNKDGENMLLSEIYDDLNRIEKVDKYYDIETKLGLIDDECELLVDWDYYKHVMMNYKESEHDYYFNCVAKNIKKANEGVGEIKQDARPTGLFKNGVPFKSKEQENWATDEEVEEHKNWDGNEVDINISEIEEINNEAITSEYINEDNVTNELENELEELKNKIVFYTEEQQDLYEIKFLGVQTYNIKGKKLEEVVEKMRYFCAYCDKENLSNSYINEDTFKKSDIVSKEERTEIKLKIQTLTKEEVKPLAEKLKHKKFSELENEELRKTIDIMQEHYDKCIAAR